MNNGTRLTHLLLTVIGIALCASAVDHYRRPRPVQAEDGVYALQFEPGVVTLRNPDGGQVLGRMAVDLRTGDIWGFPTMSSDPYPSDALSAKPKTSHPFLLGRFALEDTRK
jgi:hypothetical protein